MHNPPAHMHSPPSCTPKSVIIGAFHTLNHLLESIPTRFLETLFLIGLFWRVAQPCLFSPMDHLFSDPMRHWVNALEWSEPGIMNAIDPRLYQLWVRGLQLITHHDRALISLFSAALSVLMVFFWHRCAAEIFTKRRALAFGIILAFLPSLSIIYNYFMTETLLLTLLGASFWSTLVARREGTLPLYWLAVTCWLLCALTRFVAMPYALLGIIWLLLHQKQKLPALMLTLLMAVAVIVPSGNYAKHVSNIFAPFGYNSFPRVEHYVPDRIHAYETNKGNFEFQSPAFFTNPLHPFADYQTHRRQSKHTTRINWDNGREDWNNAVAQLRAEMTWQHFWLQKKENFIYLFFGHSWPDSMDKAEPSYGKFKNTHMVLNYHMRWMWPPLMLTLLLLMPFIRLPRSASFLIASAWALLFLLLMQNIGGMEGRYRKPLEPLLLFIPFLLWPFGLQKTEESQKRLFRFAVEEYVQPFFSLFRVNRT